MSVYYHDLLTNRCKLTRHSNFPRQYFKCSMPGCPVRLYIERDDDGNLVYLQHRGIHSHSHSQTTSSACRRNDASCSGDQVRQASDLQYTQAQGASKAPEKTDTLLQQPGKIELQSSVSKRYQESMQRIRSSLHVENAGDIHQSSKLASTRVRRLLPAKRMSEHWGHTKSRMIQRKAPRRFESLSSISRFFQHPLQQHVATHLHEDFTCTRSTSQREAEEPIQAPILHEWCKETRGDGDARHTACTECDERDKPKNPKLAKHGTDGKRQVKDLRNSNVFEQECINEQRQQYYNHRNFSSLKMDLTNAATEEPSEEVTKAAEVLASFSPRASTESDLHLESTPTA